MSVIAPLYVRAEEVCSFDNYNLEEGQSFVKIENENGVQFYGVAGNLVIEDSQPENDNIINSVSEYNKLISTESNSKKDIASLSSSPLPDSVDNSQNEYFPEIGDQGSLGSCSFWAQVYYQFTYTMNKDMGVATTYDNTFSPQWAYNVVAGTDEMIGPYYNTYIFMQKQGNVFLKQVPYDLDVTSFTPTEEVWKTSIKYRIKDYQTFKSVGDKNSQITSPNDEDLDLIKSALNNGEVLAYSTYINSWQTTTLKTNADAPQNNKYEGQYAVTSQSGKIGAHRMTLVGYNDNLWIDINSNNQVDSGEMGAFKIANSWGDDYGNDGFMWIAYDALNETSCVEGVEADSAKESIFHEISRIEVLHYNTDAQLYLKYTLNTSDRTQTMVQITAEKDGTTYTCQALSNQYSGEKIAYDGSTKATDATMILLLSNTVNDITPETFDEYNWSVRFIDLSNDSSIFTVKNAEFVNEANNTVYKPDNTYPFTLNGDEKTILHSESNLNHAVVYYRGYESPMINYKVGNGEWSSSPGTELIENTERRGYTHKYVIDLGSSDNATLYFADKNGKADDNSGKYYTAYKGLNYYVTENVSKPISITLTNDFNSVADINQCGYISVESSGGYAPYMYQFTFTNLETGETTVEEYDEKSTQEFYFRNAGDYRITVDVMDYSDEVVSAAMEIKVEDIPFKFDTLTVSDDILFVGESTTFNAVTKYEKIIYRGSSYNEYRFVVTDENNNICFDNTKKSDKYNMTHRYSEIAQSFIPSKSGDYTLTVSSTDGNEEYAEKTLSFTVYDKLYGDADKNTSINIIDVTTIQLYIASKIDETKIDLEMADCDLNSDINIIDATKIQFYLASKDNCGEVGKIIEYIPPTEPETEAPTEATTVAPTTAPQKNTITFTNSLSWSGTLYCYYWSSDNTSMTSWPGDAMTSAGTNDFGETLYTFDVPNDATYIIFTNGSFQTVDISYSGGEVRYYPLTTKTGNGYNVETW